ncbi:MAG: hypothetical protein ACXWIN_07755, partial [Burkholderiaceae bacterium]
MSLKDGMKHFQSWHLLLNFYAPVFLWGGLLIFRFVIKALLRGDTPINKWGVQEAKDLLLHESNPFFRSMAHGYIAIYFPS